MTEEEVKKIAQSVYEANQTANQFNLSKISNHLHNGIDSQRLNQDNIEAGTYACFGCTSTTSEIFTVETLPNIDTISINAIASNGAGKKASISGRAFIGNCFQYGATGTSVAYIPLTGGAYSDIIQTSSSTYIDTADLTKARVNASGNTGNLATSSYIVYVADDTAAVVASMTILRWTDTTITFKTTLAANWYITSFITLS